MSSSIVSPFPFFTDTLGGPLESGYIYIGQSNLNPETVPVNVFWDAALTIPAAQPIRTVGGYPSRSGSPGKLYASADTYSITVRDKNRVLVFNSASTGAPIFNGYPVLGTDSTFVQSGTGAVTRNMQDKARESVSVKDFGAVGDGVTDDTAAIQSALNYCFSSRTSLFVPAGHYKFTPLTFTASDSESDLYEDSEKGILIFGESRTNSWLDGTLTFKGTGPFSGYSNRFSGMRLDTLNLHNTNGDALIFSGYGKTVVSNCIVRGTNGTALSLLGGSEFMSINCEYYASVTNLKVRATSIDGASIDAAVIMFRDCDIANTVGGGSSARNIDYNAVGRNITFNGGNIISSTSPSNFTNGQVNFIAVDFESSNPCNFTDCFVNATNCLFANPTSPKINLTNSTFEDLNNLWDSSVENNIVLKDTSSRLLIDSFSRSYPTALIDHSTVTFGQINYLREYSAFVNYDFSKRIIQPYNAAFDVSYDTSKYITGGASIYSTSTNNNYVALPINLVNGIVNLSQIGAIEFIATTSLLQLVLSDGATVVNASAYGLLFTLQTLTNGFKKIAWLPTSAIDIKEVRYVLSVAGSGGTHFDSAYIYGNVVDPVQRVASYPTTGTWSKGEIVYNADPDSGEYIGWVCVTAGTPGTWKGFGLIA